MRVLISHYSFQTVGGAERVGLLMASRLADYPEVSSVTIVTRNKPGQKQLYQVLGKEYSKSIDFIELPAKQNWGGMLINVGRFHRDVHTMASRYDLCVSTYNEQDFGKPAIQYVHHPLFASRSLLSKYQIIGSINIADKHPIFEWVFNRILRRISGASDRSWLENITLTNSHFMKSVLEEAGYKKISVVYPGLIDDELHSVGDITKKRQICAIGRISPDKYTLELLSHFESLHQKFPDYKLIVCGLAENDSYLAEVEQRIKEKDLPVELKLNVGRAELIQILQESVYYINPKPFEHFGIATVEAMMCGTIPLLHKSGGSIELAVDDVQLFEDTATLVENFRSLEDNNALRSTIISKGQNRKDEFNLRAFYTGLDTALKNYLGTTWVK
ncbi:MAG: glycosyltransferase family 4 protein [Balneolales bacterium]|nr:glycosyltransferase family 4 protein [Balneolales bacterium]